MTQNTDLDITDVLFQKQSNYVVLVSGLDTSLLENVSLILSKDLRFTYLSFHHLPIEINENTPMINLKPINERVNTYIDNKSGGLIVSSLSFPKDRIAFKVDMHIHLSANKTMFDHIKTKYNYNDDLFVQYKSLMETNIVNKYINQKPDMDTEHLVDTIFYQIVDAIEKKVYGKKYEIYATSKKTPKMDESAMESITDSSLMDDIENSDLTNSDSNTPNSSEETI